MKRTYIGSLVDIVPAKRKIQNSRRSETLVYNLKKGTAKMRVCKRMFLSTLGVKEWTNVSMENRRRCSTTEKKNLLKKFFMELPKKCHHIIADHLHQRCIWNRRFRAKWMFIGNMQNIVIRKSKN
ncbi:unnamed protein product, partial [Callosobruchus maculatus]